MKAIVMQRKATRIETARICIAFECSSHWKTIKKHA